MDFRSAYCCSSSPKHGRGKSRNVTFWCALLKLLRICWSEGAAARRSDVPQKDLRCTFPLRLLCTAQEQLHEYGGRAILFFKTPSVGYCSRVRRVRQCSTKAFHEKTRGNPDDKASCGRSTLAACTTTGGRPHCTVPRRSIALTTVYHPLTRGNVLSGVKTAPCHIGRLP